MGHCFHDGSKGFVEHRYAVWQGLNMVLTVGGFFSAIREP